MRLKGDPEALRLKFGTCVLKSYGGKLCVCVFVIFFCFLSSLCSHLRTSGPENTCPSGSLEVEGVHFRGRVRERLGEGPPAASHV